MRPYTYHQLALTQRFSPHHAHVTELEQMSKTLDQIPEAIAQVQADLLHGGIDGTRGRESMTADQVLRAIIVKQMNGFSYEDLAFHLGDSSAYRAFCRIDISEPPPSKSTLQSNIKLVTPESLEAINRTFVLHANANGIENGRKIRTDSTVIKSAIHEPSDSSLLWDCVRVLVRLMDQAKSLVDVTFTDHTRRAKRRALAIRNTGSNDKRRALYDDLLRVTRNTVNDAKKVVEVLTAHSFNDLRTQVVASRFSEELSQTIELAGRVWDQAYRRVILGESVPADEKLVSIFEPHADIIVKDRRETLYGHKLFLTAGASGMILDAVVENGNPADATLAVNMVKRQIGIYGRQPRQASFDGGFASKTNLQEIKELGVQDVAFSKGRGLGVTEMVKSSWVYRRLRNFRAGVEGIISFLKRCFCLDRCTWSGLNSFKAFTWASIVAANLLIFARYAIT
jgi:IS5 family transposase